MSLEPNFVTSFCLRFTAPCSFAGDLAPVLARGLGLSPAEVQVTQGGTGVLFPVSQVRPERAAALARAFGLNVVMPDTPLRLSLAFLPRPGARAEALACWLAGVTGLEAERLGRRLRRPGGALFRDLPTAQALDWQTACRDRRDLDVEVSDGRAAVYDLFGPISLGLAADLRILGLTGCAVTGARAAALDSCMARWLERRHGNVALDRAFQRFDLMLLGCGRLKPREVADFLCLRTGLGISEICGASALRPLRIELGLPRETALRFQADYAHIGLPVALRLADCREA
jgi:hypothetical protein